MGKGRACVRTRGSKQQCCWGWLFLVASSLPAIPSSVSSGRGGGSEGPRERVHLFHVMPFCARQLGQAGWLVGLGCRGGMRSRWKPICRLMVGMVLVTEWTGEGRALCCYEWKLTTCGGEGGCPFSATSKECLALSEVSAAPLLDPNTKSLRGICPIVLKDG